MLSDSNLVQFSLQLLSVGTQRGSFTSILNIYFKGANCRLSESNHVTNLQQEFNELLLPFVDREQPIDYGELEESIRKTCLKLGLEDVDAFVTKCIQLYETTVVRHGLMLVGPTGSGKTRVGCLH